MVDSLAQGSKGLPTSVYSGGSDDTERIRMNTDGSAPLESLSSEKFDSLRASEVNRIL